MTDTTRTTTEPSPLSPATRIGSLPPSPRPGRGADEIGRWPSAAVIVVALAVAAGVATVAKHGPAGPWVIAVIALALAAAAGTGRLTLPANPLVRHLVVAVVGGALLLLFSDHVSAFSNFQMAEVAYYVPAIAGLNLLTGLNGQLSLGHGALMAVGAYTVALWMTHQPHAPIVGLLLAATLVTAVAGVVIGLAAARLRGPYLAGATLTVAVAVPEVANHFRSTLGGEQGLNVRPLGTPGWLAADFPPERWLAWVGIVVALLTLVLVANLSRSAVGRRFRAVRDDETAASLAGINVARTQILAFVISAAAAGLAGALLGLVTSVASPGAFGLFLSLSLLTAVVIGGIGSAAGPIWGAIALVFVPHYTDNLSKHFKFAPATKDNLPLAIYGLVLVVAMLLFPEGVQGGLRRLAALLPSREARARAQGETQPASIDLNR
jgi:branched-chain amino acid transport system permease protein